MVQMATSSAKCAAARCRTRSADVDDCAVWYFKWKWKSFPVIFISYTGSIFAAAKRVALITPVVSSGSGKTSTVEIRA